MAKKTLIKHNYYQDSVELMKISVALGKKPGICRASVMMGTSLNKAVLEESEMLTPEADAAGSSDMIMVVDADSDASADAAFADIEAALNADTVVAEKKGDERIETLAQAAAGNKNAALAFISVPGVFAAEEALKALKLGLNVFLFSDNVSVQDEIRLKKYAHEKGLIVMGPDCGTSHLNGIPYGFSNTVRKGGIGIVGASGTGTQEIMCLVDRFGGGISNAFGTGSHDLSKEVGGLSTLDALECLARDESTKVIVLVSKPACESVASMLYKKAADIGKPIVSCLIGADPAALENAGSITYVATLEEAAIEAVRLEKGTVDFEPTKQCYKGAVPSKYVRGLYSGGSLASEAVVLLASKGLRVFSNIATCEQDLLADVRSSRENTVVDMGDDTFTRGKPHPMISMTARTERIMQEAADPEVGVILLDVVLGYGSNDDPAGELCPAIRSALSERKDLRFVVDICGTPSDPQNSTAQAERFKASGADVEFSNVAAVEKAWAVLVGEA